MNVEEIPGKLRETFEALKLGLTDLYGQVTAKHVLLEIRDDGIGGTALGRTPVAIDVPFPAGACSQGLPTEVEAIGDLLGDLFMEQGLLGARVAACLPLAASVWKVVRWPYGEIPEDGASGLRLLSAELDMPWPLPAVYLDAQPLPGSAECSLVVASPRQVVDGWVEVFALAGVQLQRLLPAQICEWLMLQRSSPQRSSQDGEHWLLEIGSSRSRLWVEDDGVPLAEWSLPGQRRTEGLDGELRIQIDRRRRFWRQRQTSRKPQIWRLYGSHECIEAAESDLQGLLGSDSLTRWQPPSSAANLALRLSGLRVTMGWT